MEVENCETAAKKMGVRSTPIIRQANELLRLTEVRRQSLTGLNLPSSCKVVQCLELAASVLEQPFDKKLAQKVSGVNRKVYSTNLKALERVLGLQTKTSIRELAIQFGCTEATDLAMKILAEYEKVWKSNDLDLGTPLFHGSALVAATRKLKIKIDRAKLLVVTGSKKAMFDSLVQQLEKVSMQLDTNLPENSMNPQPYLSTLQDRLDDTNSIPVKLLKVKDEEKTQVDDYEDWKRNILKKAREQLARKS